MKGNENSTMWKSTFREIKQSLGRFCAILAIVALGVSLFGGLKVTRASMVKTLQKYLEETAFYDYRIVSTVGYDQEAVDAMRIKEDVVAAEGAVSFDILCMINGGSELVVKAHSLTKEVNKLRLTAGRMPIAGDECVVDSLMAGEEQIGRKILLSEANAEGDLENFTYREYTIVGIVQSPLYIQFERGNTALGNGRISGFLYMLPEGFAVDYFTEIYVKFRDEFELYSEAYDTYLEKKETVWKEMSVELAQVRYERVLKDAEEEIADSREKLEEGRTEGFEELEEARIKLEEAELEINDAKEQLADAWDEWADGRTALEEKEQELIEGEKRLEREEQTLVNAEEELAKNLAIWQEQQAKLQSGQAQLEAGQAQLTAQATTLTQKETELAQAQTLLAQQEQQLLQQETLLIAKEVQLLMLEPLAVTEELKEEIRKGKEEISSYKEQIADGKKQIADAKAQLSDGRSALVDGKDTLSSYQEKMNEGNVALAEGQAQLDAAYEQLLAAQIQLAEGRISFEKGRIQIVDGRKQIEEGYRELEKGEQELLEAETELKEGILEYEDGLKEYEDGRRTYEEEIADAEKQLSDAEESLQKMEAPDSYVLGRNTNIGYVCFESDSGIVDGIANVFPVFFFAVAALVCITTMNRMVEEQRTQIGVLKALGYSKSTIMGKYVFYSGTAAATGCISGFFLGTWLFPIVIWFAYGIMYKVDSLLYVFDWKLALISLMVSMLCSVGATWFSCRNELAEVAAQLMRPKAPKSGKRVFLERIPFIWSRMKFLHKVSYRNIFRYKKRFFMMVVGISGCTALLVTGFGVKDSISDVATHQFEKIQVYDISVNFTEAVTEDTARKLEHVLKEKSAGYMFAMEASMDVMANDQTKSVYVVAVEESEDIRPYIDLHTEKKEPIANPAQGECVMSQNLAEKLKIQIGDTITLRDENMQTLLLTVSDFHVNYISDYIYISTQTYEDQISKSAECKTAYINLTEGSDAHKLSAALMKLDGVSSVSVIADMLERFNSMMGAMDMIVLVIILCAAGLAFIVLYNLTNINITERIREIATIKVLGFYKNETSSYVFRENVVLTFIGALIGLLLGKVFHTFVMSQITIDMVSFDVRVNAISYVYSIVLTLVFACFVNWFMGKKLDQISMTESLKSVD